MSKYLEAYAELRALQNDEAMDSELTHILASFLSGAMVEEVFITRLRMLHASYVNADIARRA